MLVVWMVIGSAVLLGIVITAMFDRAVALHEDPTDPWVWAWWILFLSTAGVAIWI